MKTLSVVGTAAMFLVGGGILTHGVPVVHHWIESVGAAAGGAGFVVPMLLNGVAGIIAGAVVLAGVSVIGKVESPERLNPEANKKAIRLASNGLFLWLCFYSAICNLRDSV